MRKKKVINFFDLKIFYFDKTEYKAIGPYIQEHFGGKRLVMFIYEYHV